MKKFLKIIIFPLLLVFLAGCPYESSVPLSDANEKYPAALLGDWVKSADQESETPDYYVVEDVDGYNFNIYEYTYSYDDEEYSYTQYSGHQTTIGDVKFLNIYDGSTDGYYFYKLEWTSKEEFSLHPVTEYIKETFVTSDDLYAYFEKYKDLSFFYEEAESYVTYE